MNPLDMPGVDPCAHCDRPMRPFRATVEDFPGTLYRASKDCCGSCKNSLRKGRGAVKAGRFKDGMKCEGCGYGLRPYGATLEEYPDTKQHSAGGRCKDCVKAYQEELNIVATQTSQPRKPRRRVNQLTIGPRPEGLSHKSLMHRLDLEGYIEKRRRRNVPMEGLPLETWIEQTKVEG